MSIYEWPGARPGVIGIEKSHLAMNEQGADDGVIFLWHFSKVSINDLFSQKLKGNLNKSVGPIAFLWGIIVFFQNRHCIIENQAF